MPRLEYEENNTQEECERYLQTTLEILDTVTVPEDLRIAAFTVVAGWVSSKTLIQRQQIPLDLNALRGRG